MFAARWMFIAGGIAVLSFSGVLAGQTAAAVAPSPESESPGFTNQDCPFFGPQPERFYTDAYRRANGMPATHRLSSMTGAVTNTIGYVPGGSRTYDYNQAHTAGSIDSYIWADFQKNGIAPAPKTTDWEFIRRVTLDLTGRIPTPARVLTFVADTTPNKRANLIAELLAKPEWMDKWNMF